MPSVAPVANHLDPAPLDKQLKKSVNILTRVNNTGSKVAKCCDPSFKVVSLPLVGRYQPAVSKFN